MQFSLLFFSSGEDFGENGSGHEDKYEILFKSARFADTNNFQALWVPERHFTGFGCIYPNPPVVLAGLARETKQVKLRAASVAITLHDSILVTEDWAVVDNLSNGRVGFSCASGWHPNDFVLNPTRYKNRHQEVFNLLGEVKTLWGGGTVSRRTPDGKMINVRTYPSPIQKDLPVWIAIAGRTDTFRTSGEMGLNVITHLMLQDIPDLAKNIQVYRQARADAGHDPDAGVVTLYLHASLGQDSKKAIHEGVEGLVSWFKSEATQILAGIANHHTGKRIDFAQMGDEEMDQYARFACDRALELNKVVFGTPEENRDLIARLESVGVDEIAFQTDYFVGDGEMSLKNLEPLNELKDICDTKEYKKRVAAFRESKLDMPEEAAQEEKEDKFKVASQVTLAELRDRCPEEISAERFYSMCGELGLEYDSEFRSIKELYRGENEALARVSFPEEAIAAMEEYDLHPALLDSCFQALIGALPDEIISGQTVFFAGFRNLALKASPQGELWSHARLRKNPDGSLEGDINVYDARESLVLEASGLKAQTAGSSGRFPFHNWLYETGWESLKDLPASGPVENSMLFSREGSKKDYAGIIGEAGVFVSYAAGDGDFKPSNNGHREVRFGSQDDLEGLFASLSDEAFPKNVIYLAPESPEDLDARDGRELEYCEDILNLIHALSNLGKAPRICIITRGARSRGEGENTNFEQSVLWGAGKTMTLEHPEFKTLLIDIPRAGGLANSDLITSALRVTGEDEILVREEAFASRMKRVQREAPEEPALDSQATFLITGGLGALGLRTASWLCEKGARSLLLSGRGAPSEKARQVIEELEKKGVRVQTERADVSRYEDVENLLKAVPEDYPLRGVIHAAGVLDDGILLEQNMDRFRTVFAPKTHGARNLHLLTRDMPLDFFTLFSSAASFMGSPGQGNYAAANAFLDGLASYRASRGLAAQSINWGPWEDAGMAEAAKEKSMIADSGVGSIAPAKGLRTLGHLMNFSDSNIAVIPMDWGLFARQLGAKKPPFFKDFLENLSSDGSVVSKVRTALFKAGAEERTGVLAENIQEQIARVLGSEAAYKLDRDRSFRELGFDSLMAVELRNWIETEVGVTVPVAQFLKGPSLNQLAQIVITQLEEEMAVAPVGALEAVETEEWEEFNI